MRPHFIELTAHAATTDGLTSNRNTHLFRIDRNSTPADRRQDTTPVRVRSRPGGFYQCRVRDRARNLQRLPSTSCLLDMQTNKVLYAFPIGDDLLCQRTAHLD